MVNVHLSYKRPSSCRILFRSEERPSQFSCLKRFRSLKDPVEVCCKGINIHGRQLPSDFTCNRTAMIENNRGCNGSVCQ